MREPRSITQTAQQFRRDRADASNTGGRIRGYSYGRGGDADDSRAPKRSVETLGGQKNTHTAKKLPRIGKHTLPPAVTVSDNDLPPGARAGPDKRDSLADLLDRAGGAGRFLVS